MAQGNKVSLNEFLLGPNDTAALIAAMSKDEIQQPVMIWAQPGVGKSEIIAEVARLQGRKCIDVRLLLMEPTDLRGIPFKTIDPDTGKEVMIWACASFFPTDPNDRSIIFLDELTAAPSSVQAAALQLVLNRRIGDYILPKGVYVVAAGNRETDRTGVNRMPSALANRFTHVNMHFEFKDWREWAFKHSINQNVISFLSVYENHANTFDPTTNAKAFATPRTWSFVSNIMKSKDLTPKLLHAAISGTVGDGVAGEFMRHLELATSLPKIDDILTGKITKSPKEAQTISASHAICTGLIFKINQYYKIVLDTEAKKVETGKGLTVDEWGKMASHLTTFIMDENNITPDLAVMTLQTILTILHIGYFTKKYVPELGVFLRKYKGLINFDEESL